MKKFLKPLIIATSVACVAGIGVVSFAKWEGDKDQTAAGTTANITTVGLKTITAPSDALLPYDQPGDHAAGSGSVEMWKIVVESEGETDTYKLTGKVAKASGSSFAGKIYVKVSATDPAAPDPTTAEASRFSGWTELTVDSSTATQLVAAGSVAASQNIYVIMDSSVSTTDMDQQLTFTFALE